MDPSALQHVSGDADLAPRLVINSLALAVLGGDDDECIFESGHVVFGVRIGGLDTLLEIATLLNEVNTLQGIGVGDAGFDAFKSLAERLGRNLSPAPRPVLLEGHEVAPDCISLTTACSERTFVLVTEGGFGLSLTGRHGTIVARIASICNALSKEPPQIRSRHRSACSPGSLAGHKEAS